MTGSTRSSHELDPRRKRALFRAWRRGTREMDLILGGFADAHIGELGDHDLADFEALMEVADDELFTWFTGHAEPEQKYRSPVFRAIVAFHAKGHANAHMRKNDEAELFSPSDPLSGLFRGRRAVTLGGVPDGLEGRVLARLAEAEGSVLFVGRDAREVALAETALRFFAPKIPTLTFPAWDSLPYDRVSPNPEISASRMSALHALLHPHEGARVVFTTANAIVQRVPDRESVAGRAVSAAAGNVIPMEGLVRFLEANGFDRTATVREVGEYAVRGGILDLFAPGTAAPIRLDFFGDTLETIRPFDPATQRTAGQMPRLELVPASEVVLSEETIGRFRQNYRAAFGAVLGNDPLYEAVSEGRRFAGMEHWLPFFYEKLETLFDYLPDAPVIIGHLVEHGLGDRLEQVRDHFEARREAVDKGTTGGSVPYKPIPPAALYLSREEWREHVAARPHAHLTPFVSPEEGEPDESVGKAQAIDMGGRAGPHLRGGARGGGRERLRCARPTR